MNFQSCQVCHKICRPLRCTKCQNAWYCSVHCQGVDWKAGHRKSCRAPREKKVKDALKELKSLALGVPLDKAQEHYYKARDEVERQIDEPETKSEDTKASVEIEAVSQKVDKTEAVVQVRSPQNESVVPLKKPQHALLDLTSKGEGQNADYVSFVVEDMRHILRYQITLKEKPESKLGIASDGLDVSMKQASSNHTLVTLKSRSSPFVFRMELPRRLESRPSSLQMEEDGTIHLRLEYQGDPCDPDVEFLEKTPTADEVNRLQCRFCDQPLLASKAIKRVLPLPSGYWEEIADYLICYSGQPIVEFTSSSTSAHQSVAMQDANVVCLHQEDVGHSVCILAVSGYGEGEEESNSKAHGADLPIFDEQDASATVRGARSWRDANGGATICCSQCCSTLGFASLESPQTYRFLKHRLTYGKDTRVSSSASFLARELVRYAEAKAIFTFIVGVEASESKVPQKCLLLRLVSWDTAMANRFEEPSSNHRLDFSRVAKVVYEETVDKLADNYNSEDVTNWVWGGVDLCCIPGTSGELHNSDSVADLSSRQISTVRLHLPLDEWEEVRQSLVEGASVFPKSVAEATILVKLGRMGVSVGETLGLSAIPLHS